LSIGNFDNNWRSKIILISDHSYIIAINAEDTSNQWFPRIHDDWIVFHSAITIGDINNNGKSDIVVSCEGTLNLYAIEPDSSGENLYWSNRGGTRDFIYTHSLADIDEDFDGFSDSKENTLGTNSTASDSDGDSIPDAWEYYHGFAPLDSTVSLCEFVSFNNHLIAIAIVGGVSAVLVIVKKKEWLKQSIIAEEKNEI